jgi:hypothetical protein
MLLNIKCVFRVSLQLLSETFLILSRTERDMTKNVFRSCQIVMKLGISDRFSKNIQTSNSMKIRPVGA